jgi:two-component system chemotaxis response regulator CheY
MKCLVVDDARLARRMVIKKLHEVFEKNLEIFEATNGLEGVDSYKTHKPDICFMDLTMPEMDGFEATAKINELYPDAQIVVVSADIQEMAIKKAQDAGAVGFIKKPIDHDNLVNMLEELNLL